jgi:hypothetical protein
LKKFTGTPQAVPSFDPVDVGGDEPPRLALQKVLAVALPIQYQLDTKLTGGKAGVTEGYPAEQNVSLPHPVSETE